MRSKVWSSGKTYYYYDTCAKPRKWLPLGPDYLEALRMYADYEKEYNTDDLSKRINNVITFKFVSNRYLKEVVPSKAPRTQKDNIAELDSLLKYFDNPPAPINDIQPVHIREYLDWRGKNAQTRANRERALFSHIFNKAREWGYTANENPCRGVRGFKETGHDVYVSDEVFWRLFEFADTHIKDIMMVAYLIGQRVADVLKIKITDIQDGALWIEQNKVKTKVRIALTGDLLSLIETLLAERGNVMHSYLFINKGRQRESGRALTYNMLRGGMDRAREKAGIEKAAFQFRDLRAKAATDTDEMHGIEAARNILGHRNQNMTNEYIRRRLGKLVAPTKQQLKGLM